MAEVRMERADRLLAIVEAVAPVRPLNRVAAPYHIETRADGTRRVIVQAEDGSSLAGNGATLEDAIADLEQKVGLRPRPSTEAQ
jgi:hypothetical protein